MSVSHTLQPGYFPISLSFPFSFFLFPYFIFFFLSTRLSFVTFLHIIFYLIFIIIFVIIIVIIFVIIFSFVFSFVIQDTILFDKISFQFVWWPFILSGFPLLCPVLELSKKVLTIRKLKFTEKKSFVAFSGCGVVPKIRKCDPNGK